jgi:hypothetical protein
LKRPKGYWRVVSNKDREPLDLIYRGKSLCSESYFPMCGWSRAYDSLIGLLDIESTDLSLLNRKENVYDYPTGNVSR